MFRPSSLTSTMKVIYANVYDISLSLWVCPLQCALRRHPHNASYHRLWLTPIRVRFPSPCAHRSSFGLLNSFKNWDVETYGLNAWCTKIADCKRSPCQMQTACRLQCISKASATFRARATRTCQVFTIIVSFSWERDGNCRSKSQAKVAITILQTIYATLNQTNSKVATA